MSCQNRSIHIIHTQVLSYCILAENMLCTNQFSLIRVGIEGCLHFLFKVSRILGLFHLVRPWCVCRLLQGFWGLCAYVDNIAFCTSVSVCKVQSLLAFQVCFEGFQVFRGFSLGLSVCAKRLTWDVPFTNHFNHCLPSLIPVTMRSCQVTWAGEFQVEWPRGLGTCNEAKEA